MGFLFGPAPIRRTIPYLQSGKLILKNRVKIMEVHYNMYWKQYRKDKSHLLYPQHDAHIGLREFYFWNIPQIQYMNPNVQIVRFLEMTPNPFIRCWLQDGKDILFDCDSQTKESIMKRLIQTLGKTEEQLEFEASINVKQVSEENDAIFGVDRKRFCMCEVPGQCPCPSVIKLPKNLRGKFTKYLTDDLIKQEKEIVEDGKDFEDYRPPQIAIDRFFQS
ncbi:mitochondrial ribosomal protein S25 [Dermatophagoides pteronyssinus]|uniref:28S ribosomal protein S25, mitochondrial n=2 Tax=Dermatophagoides pteronyssinus TaxID=6956 RepID=A0ABQ8J6A6_DERPT|nr:probable 28S ribosomal protein S25, mitochondrial [Dermatophagoides pteronyssinus]KAH9418067.1 28S ribosomal protein S25, mitochondrial [Dermatophagoides pteronyssinus]